MMNSTTFSCQFCQTVWLEPITLFCGHTFCRKCLVKMKCKTCGELDPRRTVNCTKTNVLLSSCAYKWFPQQMKAMELKAEGNEMVKKCQYETALEVYTKALEAVPDDWLILSNRSQALYCLERYEEALVDAERVIALAPQWIKGYFRAGQSLMSLNRNEEAAKVFLRCIQINPKVDTVRSKLAKLCDKNTGDISDNTTTGSATGLSEETIQEIQTFLDPTCNPQSPAKTIADKTAVSDEDPDVALCLSETSKQEDTPSHKQEVDMDEDKEIAVFVCTMAFPKVRCSLNVFEPRYKLMMRYCMESARGQFGMCVKDAKDAFAEYGTMMMITNIQYLSDGRCTVDCIGSHRFRVLSRGQRDGYNTAKVSFIDDQPIRIGKGDLQKLHNKVRDDAQKWFSKLKSEKRKKHTEKLGSFPEVESESISSLSDGPAWCWWLLAVLPLENSAQLTILAMDSWEDRLKALETVLTRLLASQGACRGFSIFGRRSNCDAPDFSFLTQDSAKRKRECSLNESDDGNEINSEMSSVSACDVHSGSDMNASTVTPSVAAELLDKEDFECSLCMRLLWEPITTPCGHVFCKSCLNRCLDHSCSCPLCKSSLVEFHAEGRKATTHAVVEILQAYFSEDYDERKVIHEQELDEIANMGMDKDHEIALFVCTQAYPNIACPLHVFEPRYRLMMRQCMESGTRQFGMCAYNQTSGFVDYGTMMLIRNMQLLADGRSFVDCIGSRRFRILSRGQRDGYNTAKVTFIDDQPISDEDMPEVQKLHDKIYADTQKWFSKLKSHQRYSIIEHIGEFPEAESEAQSLSTLPSGPKWCWWLLAVLPLESSAQLAIFSKDSLKERLKALSGVLKGH